MQKPIELFSNEEEGANPNGIGISEPKEKIFFRATDTFLIYGNQISILSYLIRHQCGAKSNAEQALAILKEIVDKQETRQSQINKAMDDVPSDVTIG